MDYCGALETGCYTSLWIYAPSFLVLLLSFGREHYTVARYKRSFRNGLISFSEVFFGKVVSAEQGGEGSKVSVLQLVDLLRLVVALLLALLPLEELAFANRAPTVDNNVANISDYRLNGLHVWVDTIIMNGLIPFLLFAYLLILEVRIGVFEGRWKMAFLVFTTGAQLGQLFFLLEVSEKHASESVRIGMEAELTGEVIELILKLVLCFLYCCINRDMELLGTRLRKLTPIEYHPLLDGEDYLGVYGTEESEDVERSINAPGRSHIKHLRTPEQTAGLFSSLTFYWLGDLMRTGYDRPLEEKDFFKIRVEDESIRVARDFEKAWERIFEEYKGTEEYRRNLAANLERKTTEDGDTVEGDSEKVNYWILARAMNESGLLRPFYEAALFKLIYDTLNFVPPQMVNAIIRFMSDTSSTSLRLGFIYIGILFVSALVQTLVLHIYFHRVYRAGIRIRSALLATIYQKSLKLSQSARNKKTVGEIVNLMSTDSSRLQSLFTYLHIAWSAVYVIFLSTGFLWFQMKYAVFVALGVIVCFMMPLTSVVAKKIKSIQKDVMRVKDNRIKLTTETITSIKVIKLYGWERAFRSKVSEARLIELQYLWKYFSWRTIGVTLWNITPIVMTLSTFATYALVERNSFDAATAFTSLSLLNLLRFPLAMLPNIINAAMEATVSLKRISSFLQSEEVKDVIVQGGNKIDSRTAVEVAKGTFYWDDACEKVALRDVNFSIAKGKLCIVTGRVGSGKTALLRLFINGLVKKQGSVGEALVNGSVAYSAQVPWIQNATLKNNILFGTPYEKEWYEKVLFACALEQDMKQLPHGDATEIGERGINLSGGQKARIALARAVYSRKEILLLESCFEAVDEHVGDHIWNHCFLDLLMSGKYGERTILCVTHALKRMEEADVILVLKDGSIDGYGSYESLVDGKSKEFTELFDVLKKQQEREVAFNGDSSESAEGLTKAATDPEAKLLKQKSMDSVRSAQSDKVKQSVNNKKTENDLTGKEERGVGQVSLAVYWNYIQSAGGLRMVSVIMFCYFMRTGLNFATTRWLAYWSSHSPRPSLLYHSGALLDEDALLESAHRPEYSTFASVAAAALGNDATVEFYLGVYAMFCVGSLLFIVVSLVSVFLASFKASRETHEDLILKVGRAKMSFFDTTPSGRILNRFSKDIYTVDEVLPFSFQSFLSTTFTVFGTLFSIAYVAPNFLLAVPFLSVLYRFIQKYYISSSRELKRWDSVLRSPIYSFFTETLEGVGTIRAYHCQDRFVSRNLYQIDRNQRAYYLSVSANRWLAVRLEFIGTSLVVLASLFVVLRKDKIDPSLSGLALTYALSITQTLNWTVRMFSELETNIVSVERLNDYMKIESEAAEVMENDKKLNWPSKGELQFIKVKAMYRPGLPLVLKGVTFTVRAGEKVGVVGRTGAGKSSLFLVAMRILEVEKGLVLVDGVNIRSLGLEKLRQGIAIIPQDPVMFSGSLRQNLDPLQKFSDDEMMKALELCHLDTHFKDMVSQASSYTTPTGKFPELDVELNEGGSNLSFGQRQLVCIARALLRSCKILLLDEATSGIDLATDSLIQETIRSQFISCTVLTVAHRIETILGGDKVIVMDAGKVAEFDTPQALLQNPSSQFFGLVEKMKSRNGATEEAE